MTEPEKDDRRASRGVKRPAEDDDCLKVDDTWTVKFGAPASSSSSSDEDDDFSDACDTEDEIVEHDVVEEMAPVPQ